MPIYDWTRVDAGIYHAFHHSWIEEIHRAVLKRLPPDYYSLPEQVAGGFGPDVLALKRDDAEDEPIGRGTATLARPKTKMYQETPTEYPEMYVNVPLESTYLAAWEAVPRRWQNVIAPPGGA
jgi:hypothetical protein